MSMPLHQEDRLWNIAGATPDAAPLFGSPSRAVEHQALFLDADDDVLLGRAENGVPPPQNTSTCCRPTWWR